MNMLTSSDFPIDVAMRELARFGAQGAYLVPTSTGLEKSIMDAHESFRGYLKDHDIHDFAIQRQGPESKQIIDVTIVGADSTFRSRMSLYRPNTKSGDPRVWVSGLGQHAKSGNLIAVLCNPENVIFVVNVSDAKVWVTRDLAGAPLNRVLKSFSTIEAATSELLSKLEQVAAEGFVPSLRAGPTGVGFTLETMLGIRANASKSPDFKGIEIKAGRGGAGSQLKKSRTSLFSQIPDWHSSPCSSGRALLDKVGYVEATTGRLQLYCTSRNVPNPQGLYLSLDLSETWLESRWRRGAEGSEVLARWRMDLLRERLKTKHASTFWVNAEVRQGAAGEEFRFTKVTHTRKPLVWNLGPAIAAGAVTMDYTLSIKPSGQTRDHGYLFKLHEHNIDVLFPPSDTYQLVHR